MSRTTRLGRAGRGDEVLSVRLDTTRLIRMTDAITNKFRGGDFYRATEAVHADAAVKIQEGMAQSLRAQIKRDRTQRPGARLEQALLHENNREVTSSDFTVLRPSWMDRSPAVHYWRQIEYGNDDIYFTKVWFTNNYPEAAGQANGDYGPPFYAPWSPGGSTAQSARRSMRTSASLYSRPQPAGYRHMRMPMQQTNGIPVAAGPFPAYNYTAGGRKVFDAYQFRSEYIRRCKAVGINLSDRDFR